jgi:hypothetical protein
LVCGYSRWAAAAPVGLANASRADVERLMEPTLWALLDAAD